MKKQWSKIALILAVFFGLVVNSTVMAADNETNKDSINEKFGLPIVVLGESLSDAQKEEVRKALEVNDPEMVEEITVTGEDLARYIQGEDRNARMFSSAKITRKEKGEGLVIERATPGNITEVTDEMYANALLTAGVEDATVIVASPIKVSGHSALTGIYKAYEVSGEKLDSVRMEVANEELGLATELAKEEGMSQEKVSELLTEIKKEIAEQNPATKEDVERIVSEQLEKLNLELSPEDRQLLIDLFDKMRNLDINFDNVKGQLEDISKDIKQRLEDVVGEEGKGFLQGILDFFKNLFQAIADIFK
ncbi:DUF1002 domain-containing protein [Bacillus salacetis]|uniref:DUF1002 domain-containing protein n=1 Tax=Bacillus salacetis TaxID=2315464 RepID=A0A3A1R141_9BACI|nr:DUF1002 domain-containing protein [Bacillus salacetis]RIW32709.1 DUF1002 domain-containing protein [Bacillus salacetis]